MSIEDERLIAKYLVEQFGRPYKVTRFGDDDGEAEVNILRCSNTPDEGVLSYATLSVSKHPVFDSDGTQHSFGVEIVGCMAEEDAEFENVISTCAFNLIKDGMPIFPGRIFPRVVELYDGLSDTLQHIMFVTPFAWADNNPQTRMFADRNVTFLQALPISQAEMDFAAENSPDQLEELFEEHQIDVYDIDRDSVL